MLDALDASPVRDRTLVVLTSDHGESLGEHDYFFDHGENLFDPSLRIPLLLAGPGVAAGRRSDALATHARPRPDAAGRAQGLLPARPRRPEPAAGRARRASPGARACRPERPQPARRLGPPLQDRGDARGERDALRALRQGAGPGRDAGRSGPASPRVREERRELELFRERIDAQLVRTRRLLEGRSGEARLSAVACENLKAMGYVQQGCN